MEVFRLYLNYRDHPATNWHTTPGSQRGISVLTSKPGVDGWPQEFTKTEHLVDGYFAVTIFPGAAHQRPKRRVGTQ